MHHIASTIISFFLSPFNWIIALVIAGYFLRKPKARNVCRIMALCLFLVFSNSWILDLYANRWQPQRVVIKPAVSFSCGIVPGGFGSSDKDNNGYFNSSADRFIQTVKLYKLGNIKHILITGGNGKIYHKNFREGAWIKEQLKICGIPDSVIFVEDMSNNTADNAFYAKQILNSIQLKPPYLLITSAYHVPRASLLFRKQGIPTIPFPCNFIGGRGTYGFWSILPQPDILLQWDILLRETSGYLWYYFIRK